MESGNLYARCARCANRCRVRLLTDGEGTVVEARKQLPGRLTRYAECPNLTADEGLKAAELEAAQLITW